DSHRIRRYSQRCARPSRLSAKIAFHYFCFLANNLTVNSFPFRNGQLLRAPRIATTSGCCSSLVCRPQRACSNKLQHPSERSKAMKYARIFIVLVALLGALVIYAASLHREVMVYSAPEIPKTWDDEAIATLEIPLANPVGSPKHVSAAYYYRIPVPTIYKSYPIYAPGHEPSDYIDKLREQEPVILWDNAGHTPSLKTGADWIKAGEIVFDAPTTFDSIVTLSQVRDPAWYTKVEPPVSGDGTIPFLSYVIRKKGTVEVVQRSC